MPGAGGPPTYVTVSDERYFLGTVALVNSLRLTNNDGPIHVIDAGLTSEQRRRLSSECEVRHVTVERDGVIPVYLKPTVVTLGLNGVVVLIDSDMIVTDSLEQLEQPASKGQLCLFPDGDADRCFLSWRDDLGLEAPVRPQTYVNSGFVVFDVTKWEPTLRRWWELCDKARSRRSRVAWGFTPPDLTANDPYMFGDQDVLNAILMSEVEPDRICMLDDALVGFNRWPHYDKGAQVVDRRSLSVAEDGRDLRILHYWAHPKPWFPDARRRLTFGAYVELFARLLTADDVPISLPQSLVPVWLRDDVLGRVVRRYPRKARRAVKSIINTLPEPLGRRARRAAEAVADRAWREPPQA